MTQVQEVTAQEEITPEKALYEFIMSDKDVAYQLYVELWHKVEEAIYSSQAADYEKADAALTLGEIMEAINLIAEPVEVAAYLAGYNDVRLDNAIKEVVKVFATAHANLKAGRPLIEVSTTLEDFKKDLYKALEDFIMALGKQVQDLKQDLKAARAAEENKA